MDNFLFTRASPDDLIKRLTCAFVRPSVNLHIFRVKVYISYPIDLKRGRMILDISSHNRSEPDSYFAQGALRGRASCNI